MGKINPHHTGDNPPGVGPLYSPGGEQCHTRAVPEKSKVHSGFDSKSHRLHFKLYLKLDLTLVYTINYVDFLIITIE